MPEQRQNIGGITEEPAGTPLVNVLYSLYRDLYKLPSFGLDMWLSTEVRLIANWRRGASMAKTADGQGYRLAYHKWSSIIAGEQVALPADDRLVADYQAYAASLR